MQPALTSSYVQIVDGWNWPWVRQGTLSAMTDLGLRIEVMAQVRTTLNNESTSRLCISYGRRILASQIGETLTVFYA